MLKKVFLFIIFFFNLSILSAQDKNAGYTINGIITDSISGQPLSFVSIAIKDRPGLKIVGESYTNEKGKFELSIDKRDNYTVSVIATGYKEYVMRLNTESFVNQVVDIGIIKLESDIYQLEAVVIDAKKPLIKQEIDRISYNVQEDPNVKSLNGLEIIKHVPLLSVGAQDKIKLKFQSNFKTLINGKESALVTRGPEDFLRTIPAESIERIEVITTPPAKYDAEGLGGIINIVLKKNKDRGINSNIGSNYNSIYGADLSFRTSVKFKKLGVSVNMGNSQQAKVSNYVDSNQFFTENYLSQTSKSLRKGNSVYATAEMSYEIDSLNFISIASNIYSSDLKNQSEIISNIIMYNDEILHSTVQNNNEKHANLGVDAILNYEHSFLGKKDRLLSFSCKYSTTPNKLNSQNTFDNATNLQPDNIQSNKAGLDEQTVQLDFYEPFKESSLEVGIKSIFRNHYSNFNQYNLDTATNQFIIDDQFTNRFKYWQDVYSAYGTYTKNIKNFSFKTGLRFEYTNINAVFEEKFKNTYNNLIPSVILNYAFENKSVNLGYTQRIFRPSIFQLNPFVNQSNSNYITTGNPELKAEISNSFELKFSNFGTTSLVAGLSYSFSNNSIQPISQISTDHLGNTITTTTFKNIGGNNSISFDLYKSFRFFKKLDLSIGGQISYIDLKGYYNNRSVNNSGFLGNMFFSGSYGFKNNYRAMLELVYFTGDVNLLGYSTGLFYHTYMVNKTLFDRRLSISGSVVNPFSGLGIVNNIIRTDDFYRKTGTSFPYSYFSIRLNYQLLNSSKSIKRNKKNINNDDTKQIDIQPKAKSH